jgi:hypothetical protein
MEVGVEHRAADDLPPKKTLLPVEWETEKAWTGMDAFKKRENSSLPASYTTILLRTVWLGVPLLLLYSEKMNSKRWTSQEM